MSRILPVMMAVLLIAFVAMGTMSHGHQGTPRTPEGVVTAFYEDVKDRDFDAAYSLVSPSSNITLQELTRDLRGAWGSLKTYSQLGKVDARMLGHSGEAATVRANLVWVTAIGAYNETRDLTVVQDGNQWKVVWPKANEPNLPPQVIPVNFLRWDVIHREGEDEWGAQNVEVPHVRITSMNAVEREGKVIVMGEIVNEDTVPGFVNVGATLIGKDGNPLGEESSLDRISHILLPKEVSPYRIDFPGHHLSEVKSVRIQPNSVLVPASADPVIGVLHQRLEKTDSGHMVLKGELLDESGQIVNIPHVLATYYDNAGKVIWVSDGYVDNALRPQVPEPFSVALNDDVAPNVKSYRVTVNHYSTDVNY